LFAVARASLPSQKENQSWKLWIRKRKERSEGVPALAKKENQSWKLWIRKRKGQKFRVILKQKEFL
jgi:hypothetical protein